MNPDDAVYFANPGVDKFNPSYYFHWADYNNGPICGGQNPGKDEWKLFIGGTSGTAGLLSIPMRISHRLLHHRRLGRRMPQGAAQLPVHRCERHL